METITIQLPYQEVTQYKDKVTIEVDSLSQVSDGYHTIAELYDHRITLFIALCRKMQGWKYPAGARNERTDGYAKIVTRSKLNSDGESYPGWFLLMIETADGTQISYHIPLERWDETDFAGTLSIAYRWDGHTSADVLERLKTL